MASMPPHRASVCSLVFVLVAAASGVAVLSPQAGCADALGLCKPTARSAGVTILSAWCERYTQCDPKRGMVDDCVSSGLAQRPNEDGCAESCSEDTRECRRSTCDEEEIDKCKTDSFAMKCEDQVSNMFVHYPNFCDSCFN